MAQRLTVEEIAQEIAAYLPNPGHFQQAISAADAEPDGRVTIMTADGQRFRLTIDEVCPACGSANTNSISFGSFGGTTEGYEECRDCGQRFNGHADLSAVL